MDEADAAVAVAGVAYKVERVAAACLLAKQLMRPAAMAAELFVVRANADDPDANANMQITSRNITMQALEDLPPEKRMGLVWSSEDARGYVM